MGKDLNGEPRKSDSVANAVNACCVGALLLYAAQRPMPNAEWQKPEDKRRKAKDAAINPTQDAEFNDEEKGFPWRILFDKQAPSFSLKTPFSV